MTAFTLPDGNVQHDYQGEAVYSWERDFVEKAVGPQMMSHEECENAVLGAAAILRLPQAPSIRFTSLQVPCRAWPQRNLVEIADWGRGQVTVLHEMGHFGAWRSFAGRGESAHGATFVTCVIMLYSKVLGLDVGWLEEKARLRKLDFVAALRPNLGYERPVPEDPFGRR